jgi:hypothetical protein
VVRPASGFRLPVVSSRQLTPTTHAIEVEKPQAFMFGPTQFTFRQLLTEAGMDVRPMSLATSPTRSHLEYTVRLSDSPYITSWLRECRSLTSVIFVLDDYQLIDSCVQTLAGHRAFAALQPEDEVARLRPDRPRRSAATHSQGGPRCLSPTKRTPTCDPNGWLASPLLGIRPRQPGLPRRASADQRPTGEEQAERMTDQLIR